jgi:hypothetical protein
LSSAGFARAAQNPYLNTTTLHTKEFLLAKGKAFTPTEPSMKTAFSKQI